MTAGFNKHDSQKLINAGCQRDGRIMKTLILAGGSGSRLFPLSREKFPKQFLTLFEGKSLFQKTLERARCLSQDDGIYVVTGRDQKYLVQDQAAGTGIACNILVEPSAKNTLPATYFGLKEIERKWGDSVVAILPSDQLVDPDPAYREAFASAEKLAAKYLVIFGISAQSPRTGFGYIAPGKKIKGGFGVRAFTEKPDRETAEKFVGKGYYWNSGMFVFETDLFFRESDLFFRESEAHAPELAEAFAFPPSEAFERISPQSLDYGIMEKTRHAAVIPMVSPWDDIGSFDAIYGLFPKNGNENAVRGPYVGLDSQRNLVMSNRLVTTIGVSDTVIIGTDDAVLVAPRGRTEEIRGIVNRLKESGDKRAEFDVTVHRPWGSYTRLEESRFYTIKRLTVQPKKRLSRQVHHHRSEHWIVVSGTAKVDVDGKEFLVRRGESTFVPIGSEHRLENPGLIPLEMIEVQIGEYIGEEDIVRIDDDIDRIDE